MSPISRRDVLAGLAASSAASIVPIRGEEAASPGRHRGRSSPARSAVNAQMRCVAILRRMRRNCCGLPTEF